MVEVLHGEYAALEEFLKRCKTSTPLAEDANAVGINTTTSRQKRRRSSDTTQDAVKERLQELMTEENRLPRFDSDPLDAAAQADLKKALEAIKGFFKDQDPEATPEVLEYFEWKDLNHSRFFQQVLQLFPHHSPVVMEFLEKYPEQMKRLQDVFHDRHVHPFAKWSLRKANLELIAFPRHGRFACPQHEQGFNDGDTMEIPEIPRKTFISSLKARDGAKCLICRYPRNLYGRRIIARKQGRLQPQSYMLLVSCGIRDMDDPSNGLQLCGNCAEDFVRLSLYLEVRVNDQQQQTYHAGVAALSANEELILMKEVGALRGIDAHASIDSARLDMQLSFKANRDLPNPNALAFHRASCMMWKMSGGTETFDKVYFDRIRYDDDGEEERYDYDDHDEDDEDEDEEESDVGSEPELMEELDWNERQLSVQSWVESTDFSVQNSDRNLGDVK
ncbi:hypothetical protein HDU96_010517 [Phlyctochytrium bullatum]|nr:hypothetical protein HDU96_010517 [Phlyctochytrium bullatum]